MKGLNERIFISERMDNFDKFDEAHHLQEQNIFNKILTVLDGIDSEIITGSLSFVIIRSTYFFNFISFLY